MVSNLGRMVLGLAIAASIAVAGYFVSNTLYKARVGINVATVKGLAERRVKADTAAWQVGFVVNENTRDADLQALYEQAESHQSRIIDLLRKQGFTDAEVSFGAFNYLKYEHRSEDGVLNDVTHEISGDILVYTEKVDRVKTSRSAMNRLIREGINLKNTPPRYLFTGLNAIKPAMLKEATQQARVAAKEFAENAGSKVGSIQSARQGGFIIRDIGDGYSDDQKILKDVRVVTTISFYLEN